MTEDEFRKWFETPQILSKYGIKKVLWKQKPFPDIFFETESGRLVFAEFELRTSNFDLHKHDEEQVDLVIVWRHDESYRTRRFKVLDVFLGETLEGNVTVDEILSLEKDLVFSHLLGLPLMVVDSLDKERYQLISRYEKAWRLIKQEDTDRFFTDGLDHLVKEFKSNAEVGIVSFCEHTKEISAWFPQRFFHPFLCFMAKAIITRGIMCLLSEGLIHLQDKKISEIANIYALSRKQFTHLKKIIDKKKMAYGLGTFPFTSEEMTALGFCTDSLDIFVRNFNFRVANSLPIKEIPLALQEMTVWKRFGERDVSLEEALGNYSLTGAEDQEDKFNPMKLEFSPARAVLFSWKLAQRLKEYEFVPPDNSEEIVRRIYDLIVQPMGVLTHADVMPNIADIQFFFYPQNRIWDVLRRFERTRGFTMEDGMKSLRSFYKNYACHFRINHT